VFGSDFGSVSFVVRASNYFSEGIYRRLFTEHVQVRTNEQIHNLFMDKNYGTYKFNQVLFSKISGSPIAYWASNKLFEDIKIGKSIDSYSDFTGSQHITADNNTYLRNVWEISNRSRWKPYSKGGEFRRWYGNITYAVDWSDKALEFYKNNSTSNLLSKEFIDVDGIAYNGITAKFTGFRYFPGGAFDKGGPVICRVRKMEYIISLLNTYVFK
jgi:hypothetical protein